MPKVKIAYVCQECGYDSIKWLGKCPGCNGWNTFVEEKTISQKGTGRQLTTNNRAVPVNGIPKIKEERYQVEIYELDRVLGGGIVPGSVVLIGGEPGIGKSTLLLQCAYNLSLADKVVLYVSGEESVQQIGMRAERLGVLSEKLFLLTENSIENIKTEIERLNPGTVIIDSIQTLYKNDIASAPGSVSQVRECAADLMFLAKQTGIAIFLVGHVTKEGTIAGPRVLEHMVDTVLYIEGERHHSFRLLRAVKNRFGSTNEIGVFEMKGSGMYGVSNPSEIFLAERPLYSNGSVVSAALEGTRSMLLEIQALVSASNFGNPRRLANGIDYNRLLMLIAVLDKRVGLLLGNQDIHLNIVGGMKITDPALDAGICLSVASSLRNITVEPDMLIIGEVGLAGEVRAVTQPEKRIKEAETLGFKKVILPERNKKNITESTLELIGVKNIDEVMFYALGR